jgi:hypothetical protein
LHAFWPLQAFSAALQSLVPLHEFNPAQCTISPLDALLFMVPAQPDKINAPAPTASNAPLPTFDDYSLDITIPLESAI